VDVGLRDPALALEVVPVKRGEERLPEPEFSEGEQTWIFKNR
jgi:hypothetical protein